MIHYKSIKILFLKHKYEKVIIEIEITADKSDERSVII